MQERIRLVVKVGTSTLIREDGSRNLRNMERLCRVLADLKGMGHQVILVSSGAIGFSLNRLGLTARPTELRQKQAAAAVGQCAMMHLYDTFFGEYGQTAGQILLSEDDVDDEGRRFHLSATFSALLELGVIPVVNENDSVSSAEIETGHRKVLGDNDSLSAVVADLCRADLLVLLSDIDGLYEDDPHRNPNARRMDVVEKLTPEIWAMAGGTVSGLGTGGMMTKLAAAQLATSRGIDVVLTRGDRPEDLYDLAEGKPVGTLFRGRRNAAGRPD